MSNYRSVYIVAHEESGGATGPVKVGVATEPQHRLRALQTGSPKPLVLYKTFLMPERDMAYGMEWLFHDVFTSLNLYGEWFNFPPWDTNIALHFLLRLALEEMLEREEDIRTFFQFSCGECGICAKMQDFRLPIAGPPQ